MISIMNDRRGLLPGNILIEDDCIHRIGHFEASHRSSDEILDCTGKPSCPSCQHPPTPPSSLLSGDLQMTWIWLTWLRDRKNSKESNMTEEDSFIFPPLLRGVDQSRLSPLPSQSLADSLSPNVLWRKRVRHPRKAGKSTMDCGEGLPKLRQHTTDEELSIQERRGSQKYHNNADGRVEIWFSIRTIFNATDELYLRTKELATNTV